MLPPSLLEWVPEDHLVWTILGAVAELDLSAIYAVYRPDGHGRPAYEPSMMVALLLYGYAKGNRSSREIERKCREDVAYMVITARRAPDHSTIAEFRRQHERALADLFTGVLGLCRKVGLVKVGLIAIDGTKLHANASQHSNRDYRRIAEELLEDSERVTGRRTSGSARSGVVMSCPSGCRPRRGGVTLCAKPSASSMPSASTAKVMRS